MANRGSILATNDYLRTDDYLVSVNGQFCAVMQSDGNLCVYEGTPDNLGTFRWGWTDWSRNQDDYFTITQSDGNLCVYWGSGPNVDMGHYINQHACSIGVGSALTATVTTLMSNGVGTPQFAVLATAAGRSGNEAALKGTVQALAHVLTEPVSRIPIPGFSPSREELQTVIAFLIMKALKGTKSGGMPGELKPGFWGGVLIYGLTEFICSGKLPGGYSVWRGAQAEIPVA